jgi:ATP-dependent DNA helicase RecQ
VLVDVDPRAWVVIDLETTGTSPTRDRPIEIAAVRFEAGQEVARFESFVAPPGVLPEAVSRITGISQADLAGAPALAEVLASLRAFAGDLPLVGHNLRHFDWPMLASCCEEVGLAWPTPPLVDTLELAAILHPRLPSHRLTDLARRLEVASDEPAHRAMADVLTCARVFDVLCRETAADANMAAFFQALTPAGTWPTSAFLAPAATVPSLQAALRSLKPVVLPPRPPATGADVDLDHLAASLAARGEARPAQAEMVKHVGLALLGGRKAMIEAPTGTGKTRAYLAPALAHARANGGRVIVAPNSRLLQSQVIEELRHLAPDARICRFLGAQNLVCRMHLGRAVHQAAADPAGTPLARRLALLQVLCALRGTTEGSLRELATRALDQGDPDGEGALLREEVALGPGCTEPEGPEEDDPACWGRAMLRNARRAEIIVTNQVMLVRSLDTLAPLGDVVFDEAHNLEDAATLAWSADLSARSVEALAGRIVAPDERRGLARELGATHPELAGRLEGWHEDLLTLAVQVEEELARYLTVRVPRRSRNDDAASELRNVALHLESLQTNEWKACADALLPLQVLLGAIADGVGAVEPTPSDRAVASELQGLAERAIGMRDFLKDFLGLERRVDHVYTVLAGGEAGRWSLRREIIRVGEQLQELVYNQARAVVWTSATLTVAHDFGFVANRIGADLARPDHVMLPPVFDYGRNAMVVLTNHLPTPRGVALAHEFPTYVAEELARYIRVFDGRLLGLFTSRARMQRVAALVADQVRGDGYEVMAQARDLETQLEAFRGHETSSLFGVKSLWEGVSVEGASLSHVAMSKLPFPHLSPVMEARAELVRRGQGKSPFFDYAVPLAALQFKQGFGRLNRTATDRGAVLVLDRRLRYAISYRDAFLRSLPGPPRMHFADGTDFYQAVADFLGRPFDPDTLGSLRGTLEERALLAHTLPQPVLSPQAYAERRPQILQALRELFGHTAFRDLQEEIIEAQLTGRDVLAILPTGAGKSLTFQLPALLRDGLTLVISPLVALMKDQIDSLRERVGARLASCLIGGQSIAEQREILSDVESGQMRLLYIGPERLLDPRILEALRRANMVQLVVDEAHCVAAWGNSFRPDFLDIRAHLADFPRVPVAALTATAPPSIRTAITERLGLRDPRLVVGAAWRPNLHLAVLPCGSEDERLRVLAALVRSMAWRKEYAGIVYTAYTSTAQMLERFLREQNVRAAAYHGQMAPQVKHGIQEQFMNGDLDVIVATAAFGMGVDKADVRFVIHYDLPESPEMYYQEAGRAGRDGAPAWGILLNAERGLRDRRFLVEQALPDPGVLAQLEAQLKRCLAFGGRRYVVAEELRVGNGRDVKGLLHKLAQQGGWHRGGGFTAVASFKLWTTRKALAEALRAAEADREVAEAMVAFLTTGDARDWGERELRPAEAAIARGLDPARFEAALLRHASDTTYDYRTRVTGQVMVVSSEPVPAGSEQEAHTAAMARFEQMQRYMLADCRWAHLRRALGDEAPARCGQCDRCAPEADVPWDLADVVLMPKLVDILDVEAAVIEALRDLEGGIGRLNLARGLTGDEFGHALPAAIRTSAHFKRLQGLSTDAVVAVLDRMIAEGLLYIHVKDGKFQMLTMTPRGVAVLGSNRKPVQDEDAEGDADVDNVDPDA